VSTLLLVDGHALAYRSYHAIQNLRAPDGTPTNAIYGFIGMLRRIREQVGPTHVGIVWDGGMDAERLAVWPAYKAQRPPMPEALADQIESLHQFEAAAGIARIERPEVEADDLIASLAARAASRGWAIVIASSDKDFFQLVGGNVRLLNPAEKSGRLWSAEEVVAKTGVRPEQIVDWLSLVGDAVDNIPGVPGVGAKTAARLLNEFGSVNGLYAALDRVRPERLKEALAGAAAEVRRNRELVRLRADLEPGCDVDALRPGPGDTAALAGLYRRWGFRSWLAALPGKEASPQSELFAAAARN
jgi:DNA polymerase-1